MRNRIAAHCFTILFALLALLAGTQVAYAYTATFDSSVNGSIESGTLTMHLGTGRSLDFSAAPLNGFDAELRYWDFGEAMAYGFGGLQATYDGYNHTRLKISTSTGSHGYVFRLKSFKYTSNDAHTISVGTATNPSAYGMYPINQGAFGTLSVSGLNDAVSELYLYAEDVVLFQDFEFDIFAIKLFAPTGLSWDNEVPGKARWNESQFASMYTVQLYKNGVPVPGYPMTAHEPCFDFTDDIASMGSGSYTFKVRADSTDTNYTQSDESALSHVYSYSFVPVSDVIGVSSFTIVGSPKALDATVTPEDATYKTITWSVVDPGETGATITGNSVLTTSPGTFTVRATIKNGLGGSSYTKDISLVSVSGDIAVTDITDVPGSATVGIPLTLSGTVVPAYATYNTIVWSVVDPGETGATISGNTLNTTGAGTVTIRATIKNGLTATSDYTQDFTITVTSFVPVTNITGIPGSSITYTILNLNGTVEPVNATNKTITWSVADAGTTGGKIRFDGISFTATNGGTAIVRATIKNGLGPSTDYTQDFPIDVLVAATNISGTPSLDQLVGTPVPLTGTVEPPNATYKTIEWHVEDPRGSGAYIEDDVLYTTSPGHPIVVGTIRNGKITGDFTSRFYFVIQPIPVTGITGIPTSITVGEPLTLSGAVNEDATYKTILWSVADPGTTGATLSENTLYTTGTGTATIRATIQDGKALDDNYTQDFRIKVLPLMFEDTLMDTVGSTTIIAEGYFAPYAELEVTELPSGDADREELEELMGEKQILGAFEARITPADSYQPPLTLTFNVGAKYNGSMVYVLHRLESGETEQFTTTVTGGVVRIIVNELSPFLIAKDLPLSISSQPKSVRAAVGQTVSFSVWATGEPPLSYQWQRKKSGGSWKNIDGATAPDFTIDQATLAMDGVKYRVIVTDGLGNRVTSSTATLTVNKVSSPDTGDHAQPALYALLAAFFAVALVMLLKKRRTT